MRPGAERGKHIGRIVLGGIRLDDAHLVEEKGEFRRISGSSDQGHLIIAEMRSEVSSENAAEKINEMIDFLLRKGLGDEFDLWTISFGVWVEELLDKSMSSSILLLDDFSRIDVLLGFFRDLNPVKNIRSFFDEEEGPSSDVPFISFRHEGVEFFVFSRPLFMEGEHRMRRLNRDEAVEALRIFTKVVNRLSSL